LRVKGVQGLNAFDPPEQIQPLHSWLIVSYLELLKEDEVHRVHRSTKSVVSEIVNRPGRGEDQQNATTVDSDVSTAGEDGSVRRRRRRRDTAAAHDVELVVVQPPVKDSRLRTAVVATDQG